VYIFFVKRTLNVLNEFEKEGHYERYAIGGAMGATFYIEPQLTDYLDIFVILPQASGGLITLSPLYDALRAKGYKEEDEFIIIEGIPVQFLPAYKPLVEEALREAIEVFYEDVKTRVFSVEHLIAICLDTNRHKDRERVRIFMEQAQIDKDYLEKIISRYGMEQLWNQWKDQIL
jgi:hypothetical protein